MTTTGISSCLASGNVSSFSHGFVFSSFPQGRVAEVRWTTSWVTEIQPCGQNFWLTEIQPALPKRSLCAASMRTCSLFAEQRNPALTNVTQAINCLNMLLSRYATFFSIHTGLPCSEHGALSPSPSGNTLLGGTVHYRAFFTTWETHLCGDGWCDLLWG